MAEKNQKTTIGKNPIVIIAGLAGIFLIIALGLIIFSFAVGGFEPDGIAIIPLKGEISNSVAPFDSQLSSEEIVAMIEDADENPQVAAILLDIDSPGGEVVASKQIVYAVRSAKKPVYSYINSTGASGAYYVASASDYIMADADSITGSIGVISIFFNIQELLDELGVQATILKEGDLKGTGNPFKEMTEEEKKIVQDILFETYSNFKADVLEFREGKVNAATFEEIADGRILSGRQAQRSGLVDELLTKKEAIEKAGELAGVEEPRLIRYAKEELSITEILFSGGEAFGNGFVKSLSTKGSLEIR